MHAIAEYWPQSVKQAPKWQTGLVHRKSGLFSFHLRVVDST